MFISPLWLHTSNKIITYMLFKIICLQKYSLLEKVYIIYISEAHLRLYTTSGVSGD